MIETKNLIDGNGEGSLKQKNSKNLYTMGINSIALGLHTESSGENSHAQGYNTMASGNSAHAQGYDTNALGLGAHAQGAHSNAIGDVSHAQGLNTEAIGINSHAQGMYTKSSGFCSHAQGNRTISFGKYSHSQGNATQAIEYASHAQGDNTIASGKYAHAQGQGTIASNKGSHAQGQGTIASGEYAHAQGQGTIASGNCTHAQGRFTSASGKSSHAQGIGTIASGDYSHAQGQNTLSTGRGAHSEGDSTQASGTASHAQGSKTKALGNYSHAEGKNTVASGNYAHAQGLDTDTNNCIGSHVMGKHGDANSDYSWFLANGIDYNDRNIGVKIDGCTGNIYTGGFYNTVYSGYAELFESVTGEAIEVGIFVTFSHGMEKIRKCQSGDEYILGIVTKSPGILCDNQELRWKNKYNKDDWGKTIIVKESHSFLDIDNKSTEDRAVSNPIINEQWDNNQEYTPRLKRDEWTMVTLIGKVLVRDNGKCKIGCYCTCGDGGIAIPSDKGYKILKRTGPNQILILFR